MNNIENLDYFSLMYEIFGLTIDRTQWQLGKSKINFLVIAVPYKRMAIPLFWMLLEKKGNSNYKERINVLERLFKYIPQKRIKGVIGDREFIGGNWFDWLIRHDIPFYMRIIDNANVINRKGLAVKVKWLFRSLKPGHIRALPGKRELYRHRHRHKVYLTGSRFINGELMVVASLTNDCCAISVYKERWEIECLFQNLKSRGFDMESTHLTDPAKLNRLMGVLTIAACWAYKTGAWCIEKEEHVKVKKHGRPEKSLFRHGLNKLQNLLLKPFSWRAWKPLIMLWKELLPPLTTIIEDG